MPKSELQPRGDGQEVRKCNCYIVKLQDDLSRRRLPKWRDLQPGIVQAKLPLGAAGSLDDFSDSDNDEHADDHDSRHTAAPTSVSISDLSSGTAALQSSAQRRTAGIVIADPSSSAKKISVRLNAAAEPTGAQEQDDSSEYETDTSEDDSKPAQARPVFRKPGAPSQSAKKDESSEYETDSDDEGSEEEAAPPPLAKPIFVPKGARATIAAGPADIEAAQEDAEAKAEEEAAKRRQEAHDLAAATIKRQLAEKEYQETHATDVDDTDGLDPEAEFEAWRQRELARLQRDREALDEKRKAQAELDAFRALPESEKERLGRERAKQQAAEKREQRGNPAFLQKRSRNVEEVEVRGRSGHVGRRMERSNRVVEGIKTTSPPHPTATESIASTEYTVATAAIGAESVRTSVTATDAHGIATTTKVGTTPSDVNGGVTTKRIVSVGSDPTTSIGSTATVGSAGTSRTRSAVSSATTTNTPTICTANAPGTPHHHQLLKTQHVYLGAMSSARILVRKRLR
ncbi:hypothetical protein L1887_55794 [Cichorium endivia]|nr:hypothetical protein L1887_55794 [Cichorium endivia]